MLMRFKLSSAVEVVGLVLVLVAAFAVDWRLGLGLVGVLLVALGYLTDGVAG